MSIEPQLRDVERSIKRKPNPEETLKELHDQFTEAFVDLFAATVPAQYLQADGGPGYYGVRLENVAADGSEVDLVLTFSSGHRYCCFESSCHFAHYGAGGWSRLRACMDRHGLSGLPLPVIRRFRGVIERGAVMIPSPRGPAHVSEGAEYEVGPFMPISS
jgi:hypothetical protein